ncbi:MAG: PKD domain-containing protein, partial [Candidatus Hydrogenedentes bacterium]|nr:PKD domain-containing protein [Candidatus Hydrogenedentota bacterium]
MVWRGVVGGRDEAGGLRKRRPDLHLFRREDLHDCRHGGIHRGRLEHGRRAPIHRQRHLRANQLRWLAERELMRRQAMRAMRNAECGMRNDKRGNREQGIGNRARCFVHFFLAVLLAPAVCGAVNINGEGMRLHQPTTDLPSASAQTSGAGGRLLWASTPGRGVVSVNGAGAKAVIEPLHVHGVSGTFTVDFSADPQTGDAPLEVRFTDLSKSGVYQFETWVWDFGDGSPVSYEQNPVHVYEETGVYTVTLTVTTDVDALSA